jgi:hypothetical protein
MLKHNCHIRMQAKRDALSLQKNYGIQLPERQTKRATPTILLPY